MVDPRIGTSRSVVPWWRAAVLAAWTAGATGAEPTKLLPADPGAVDRFGFAVATDGADAVIGAPFDDDVAEDSGSIYSFDRVAASPGDWVQSQKFLEPDPADGDEFGFSIAISGDTMAVGIEDDGKDIFGSVVVFERNAGERNAGEHNGWHPVRQIFPSDPAPDDSFGLSVALDGDTLVVGALRGIFREAEPTGDEQPGVAYVFERHHGGADNWGEVVKLTASDGVPGDYFGFSVAVAGDVVAIGAPGDAERGFFGAVYVVERDAGGPHAWGETQKLAPDATTAGDRFGWSSQLRASKPAGDGDLLMVGAPRDDDRGVDAGAVYVFERHAGSELFEQRQKLTANDSGPRDEFGFAISIDGRFAAIGSPFEDTAANDAGSAYVFSREDTWLENVKIVAADLGAGDHFGQTLDLASGTLAVGAPFQDAAGPESGAAYIYRLAKLLPADCIAGDPEIHCFRGGRFQAEISWRDFTGGSGTGKSAPLATDESGLFWFFGPDNWEIQVKVLDGCGINQHFWVFGAASTNVEYTLRVTDTANGQTAEYFNPLGTAAPAITDVEAFAACP